MTLLRVTERTRGLDSWWRSSRPGPSAARSTQCEHGLRGTPPARTEGSTAGRAVAPLHGGAPSTWGAIYDLYQYNLAQELGENFDGLKKLQGLVEFLPTKQPYIGFGESAPVDGTHDDNAEEQADRRVEVLFFAQGQEPDIALLDEDPKVSELYHPDAFRRVNIEGFSDAKSHRRTLRIFLHDEYQRLMVNTEYELTVGTEVRRGTSSNKGDLVQKKVLPEATGTIRWGGQPALNAPTPGMQLSDMIDKLHAAPTFKYKHDLLLSPGRPAPAVEADRYLENLGYTQELEQNWEQFQLDYGMEVQAFPNNDVLSELRKTHRKGLEPPPLEDDGLADPPHEEFEDDGLFSSQLTVQLVDAGGEPVGGEDFEVRNANDEVIHTGTLDDAGTAIVLGLVGDEHFISFPNWDGSSWDIAKEPENG